MTYANMSDNGAILGSFHATKEEAIHVAKVSARQTNEQVRVVCYGPAGDVKSITRVSKSGRVE